VRAGGFILFKHKRYGPQPLRLVKYEPNRLRPRYCGAPALRFYRSEGSLNGIVLVLGGDFNDCCPLNI
jgi:hypothetical protein